jgi:signal transduction histidine kinase/DNA-binding NarL/FixJ family response regulator/HPt (histidine-containing phosphotransfer) domain-containing protein
MTHRIAAMSIRLKIFFVIIFLAITIILFGIGTGMVFVQSSLEHAVESDMSAVANVADQLITTEINLLKADASMAAQHLLQASDADFHNALQWQTVAYNNFIALTVFDREGIVDAYGIGAEGVISRPTIRPAMAVPAGITATGGPALTPAEFIHSEYIQRAFAGEMVISNTQINPNGELVFYICIPMGERVLSATITGMFFSDILSHISIWDSGNIFIVDAEGTIMSNVRFNWVLERYNFIEKAQENSQYQRIADTVKRMIAGESGSGTFAVEGSERLCLFTPISGSKVGWSLGVVAPLAESPVHSVRNGLLLVGGVCLLLSLLAALFASFNLERPYAKISELARTLAEQAGLLHTVNDAAAMLLKADSSNFDSDIWNSMEMMARSAGVDRMRVYQNYTRDGILYCSRIHEWADENGLPGTDGMRDFPYSQNPHGWVKQLSAGQSIKGVVHNLSPEAQRWLLPQGIRSLLVIPVFFQNQFWGFVSFDDCHNEREFTADEEGLLSSGGILIANAILRDEMTHDLMRAREEALASAEAKSDFLANMSHEMRTPLNAIIGLSELTLDSDEVEGGARTNLEKVYTSGVTLLSLINDILDISKIEAGKFELVPVEYDTPSLINDTVSLNIVRIGSKPITLQLEVDEALPNRLIGDELRIKQIFNNLLSNAFKYTKEGTVVWRVSFEQDGDDVWLISSIKDSGIGIKAKDLEKLFSQYNQVDTKSNRKIEGTGLGLSICKSMVELMEGTIQVESEYGAGSTFTVRIRQTQAGGVPIGPEVAENLRKFIYSEDRRDRSSKLLRAHIPYARVLVVDDVPTNLDVARGMMKPYGMQIDCVTGGQAAIDLIRRAEVKYNAIFMDHMMPDIDGIEATRIIREEIGTEYARTVPIIALTANAIVGNEDMFLQHGFQAFLSKPIDIIRMDYVINHWVRDKELEKQLAKEGYKPSGGGAEKRSGQERRSSLDRRSGFDRRRYQGANRFNIRGLDIEQGLKRFGGDEEIYLGVLRSYTVNTTPLLDQLRDFCTEESLPRYAIVVHGIKSSSRSIGADLLGVRAEALEMAAKAGDFATVNAENPGFIADVQILLNALEMMLQDIADENPKPVKAEPDAEVLAALLAACSSFEIDEVDQAMAELESYEYESRGELVEWLRAQVNVMGFKQIAERLSQI